MVEGGGWGRKEKAPAFIKKRREGKGREGGGGQGREAEGKGKRHS